MFICSIDYMSDVVKTVHMGTVICGSVSGQIIATSSMRVEVCASLLFP